MTEQQTSTPRLLGALAALQERADKQLYLNEFGKSPAVTFSVKEIVQPSRTIDYGIRTYIELHAGAHYTVFHGDKDEAFMEHRKAAYRSLVDLLYADVLRDLRAITEAVGDGERRKAMTLIGALYERLRS